MGLIKVYTHHPSDFRLDDPTIPYDPTKGENWQRSLPYRDELLKLQGMLGTKDFLWCEVVPTFTRMTEEHDLVQWEIEIEFSEILAFCHQDGNWQTLFTKSPAVDWSKLIVRPTEKEVIGNDKITCLVRFPPPNPKRIEMKPKYPTQKA